MTPPTILLTGANGQVGFELQRTLALHGDVVAFDRGKLDLGDRNALAGTVRSIRPQMIVNAAAYTAVDRAESEMVQAEAINTIAPAILAEEAKRIDAVLIHFSTDYVFDGASALPYDELALTRPLNVYGRTKRDGEIAIAAIGGANLIFRRARGTARRCRSIRRAELEPGSGRNDCDARRAGRAGACRPRRPVSPQRQRRNELVRFCARNHRRRSATACRSDHDRRVSDAGSTPRVRRARKRKIRANIRHRIAGMARCTCALPRGAGRSSENGLTDAH